MHTIKELFTMFKENPKTIYTAAGGLVTGAVLGAIAFWRGWLG